MEKETREMKKLSTSKAILGIVFAIAVLVIAQILAFSISEIPLAFGVPSAICNIIAGILYVVFVLLGTMLLCKRFLETSMAEMRISPIQLKVIWIISAVLMPIFVLLFSMVMGGDWQINTFDSETALATISGAIVFFWIRNWNCGRNYFSRHNHGMFRKEIQYESCYLYSICPFWITSCHRE